MPDILIRDVSQEVADALEIKAKAAGADSRAKWLIEQLTKLAGIPERYGYRIIGQVGKGNLRRYSDHLNGVSTTFANFNQDEADAMQKAENFIRRNAPGDRERAFNILVGQFGEDNVFEVPV